MLKNLTKLLVSLSLISNLSYAETTGNLVSQDFTTGWSGTNLSSTHGSTTIAGVDGQYVESNSVSLNASNINKESINNGLTITGSSNIYFWSGPSQSVTQTIKAVDDNGNIVTQTRILSGTSGSGWLSTLDQMVIGQNSQQDYNVSLRYDFSVPGYPTYHYGADLNSPSLTVSYTYVPPMDAATQAELFAINETIKEDLKDVQSVEIKEEAVTLDTNTFQTEEVGNAELTTTSTTTDVASAPSTSTDTMQSSTGVTDTKESPDTNSSTPSTSEESPPQESVSSDDTNSQESQKSDQASAETSDDKQEATSESNSSQDVADKDDKSSGDSKTSSSVSLSTTISNIDVKVKDPGKNLELKNLVMMDKMIDNSALLNYANIPFYKPKAIYEDQVNIRDNRILYPDASLVSYMEKDPVFTKHKEIYNIRYQKQKLINEIKALTNG